MDLKIIELPREAFQSFPEFIPTELKVRYLQSLLRVGFDTIETGSIVSERFVPQVRDTAEVLGRLDLQGSASKLMVLVVNRKGAEIAASYGHVSLLSYPFSISPAFLKMNLNATTGQSLQTIDEILEVCAKTGKKLVVYLSMAFGNDYGDDWNLEILTEWVEYFRNLGIGCLPLSNLSFWASPARISEVFSMLIPRFPSIEFGFHLHTGEKGWYSLVHAAYKAGCRRFDGVINGLGGCPMTGGEMVSNLDTAHLLYYCGENQLDHGLDTELLGEVRAMADDLFNPGTHAGN